MANCPNCGRATARTTDWCCQWCGYPLFSGTFKTINKSYEQLKRERMAQQPEVEEEALPQAPETGRAAEEREEEEVIIEKPSREETPRRIVRQDRRPPVRRRRIIKRRRPAPPPPEPEVEEYVEYIDEDSEDEYEEYLEEYEDESEAEEEYEDEYEDRDEEVYEERPARQVRKPERRPGPAETRREPPPPVRRRPVVNRRPAPLPEPETGEFDDDDEEPEGISGDEFEVYPAGAGRQPSDEYEPDEEWEEEPEIEEETEEPEPPAILQPQMELTVEELISAYESEGPQADARFAGKILKVIGVVNRVEIKEALAVYAVVLETPDANPMRQTVRCVFSREYRDELQQLVKGQEVSIQGKYDGSIINISMRNCSLVD